MTFDFCILILSEANVCLTIPKKVISFEKDGILVVDYNGKKQRTGSIIKVGIGDNVLTQNNIIVQKITKKQAKEINNLFNSAK